ncbi:MAG: ribonuclease Y [Thermaerobacterales bacterium]
MLPDTLVIIIAAVIAIPASFAGGYILRRMIAEARIRSAETEADRIVKRAGHEAEAARREALVEAKEEGHRIRRELEKETRDRRDELQRLEKRVLQREETLERKMDLVERRDDQLRQREATLAMQEAKAEEYRLEQVRELERISGMTQEQARQNLLNAVEIETRAEMGQLMRDLEIETRQDADRKAKEVIATAIQRCAADHVAETTVSVVELPSDDMKGRIIGREGRNIRTFEALAGVDLIIDDTPEAVVVSCFDPIRREKARIALEKLVADGRIHPARIEEMYEKACRDVDQRIREAGEQAMYDAGLHGLHPELIKLLGRLAFRTSYGQNVLKHSMEVAHLAGLMAMELSADVQLCRRAGLLHDVGKAINHEVEGTHITIGMELLRKFGESDKVIHAMSCHHGDFEPETIEAVLVSSADALSAARPGARRETLESYVKRLQKLEEIADSFDGVEKAYAIQAGREVRIMVKPDHISDIEAYQLAKKIVKEVQQQVQYPGQIKIVVIRETRVVDYAK